MGFDRHGAKVDVGTGTRIAMAVGDAGAAEREADRLDDLASRLGHGFSDRTLLREALTHPSLNMAERGNARWGYERFEFLGDRVLGLVIAEWLIERFPAEDEGSLAKRHTALVRREALSRVAEKIGLGGYLFMSSGEEESGGRANAAILADSCEAVIAALYLDGGMTAVRRFIRKGWADAIERDDSPPQDPKTQLQEWAQARGLPLPRYTTLSRTGPDHEPIFQVAVDVEGQERAVATGASKRAAAKAAATDLLRRLDLLP